MGLNEDLQWAEHKNFMEQLRRERRPMEWHVESINSMFGQRYMVVSSTGEVLSANGDAGRTRAIHFKQEGEASAIAAILGRDTGN